MREYHFKVSEETLTTRPDRVTKYTIKNESQIDWMLPVITRFFKSLIDNPIKHESQQREWHELWYTSKEIDNRTFEFILTEPRC